MRQCSDRGGQEEEVWGWLEEEQRSTGREVRGAQGVAEGYIRNSIVLSEHQHVRRQTMGCPARGEVKQASGISVQTGT